jgi:hypothetical protein
MASRRSRPRRLLLPTLLAAILAAELTGLALARSLAPAAPVASVATPATVTAPATPAESSLHSAGRRMTAAAADAIAVDRQTLPAAPTSPGSLGARPATAHGADRGHVAHLVAHGASPKAGPSHASSRGHAARATFRGRNHVWIPSLGINKSIQSFPCSRSRPPDAGVYRWGCAGHNNVYLLGHAWSTFKPLHDVYVRGRLHTGMKVVYADGGGTVHTYSVVWWKVVAPTTAASWAWASLGRPSMTLQTCVGANSQYRLMVRLVRVG